MESVNDISFPNLGIYLHNVPRGFSIGSHEIRIYGILIAVAFVLAYFLACRDARRNGLKSEDVQDAFLVTIIPAIIGARLYYVIFNFKEFRGNLKSILYIWNGGLAVYGGIILGALTLFIFCRVKKISVAALFDTIVPYLALGQAIGRWGNFFNREAFGDNTDSLFAMRIPYKAVNVEYSSKVVSHVVQKGETYIQVQPMFLYESTACLLIFIILMIYRKHRKCQGEVMLLYMILYGCTRTVTEQFRTDQLILAKIGEVNIPVSQVVSVLAVICAVVIWAVMRARYDRALYITEDGNESEAVESQMSVTEQEDEGTVKSDEKNKTS